jgi:hypothetical protein
MPSAQAPIMLANGGPKSVQAAMLARAFARGG